MSKKVFFNTSAIQYLHQLRLIHIIKDMFGKAYVPAEVDEELRKGREEGIELPDLEEVDFIEVIEARETPLTKLVRDLGKGERSYFP